MTSTLRPPDAALSGQRDPFPLATGAAVLRRMAASDLQDFQSYRRDAALARFQGWSPQTDAQALAFLQAAATAPLFEPGVWVQLAIAEPHSLKLVGDIGLCLAPDGAGAEVGFTLARPSQGTGMATSAVRAAIGLVFARTAVTRIIGVTDQRNAASIRLLERLDMRLTESRAVVFKAETCTELVYALERPAAPAQDLPPAVDRLAKLRAMGVGVPAGPVCADGHGDTPKPPGQIPVALDLEARRPVWAALSSMFLDADVSLTRAARAAVLAASPCTAQALEQILIDEVYPVCWANLNVAQGESVAFDPDWLESMILQRSTSSETCARLQDLARIAVPHSTEWLATLAAVAAARGAA